MAMNLPDSLPSFSAQIQACSSWAQTGPQPNVPPVHASTTLFYDYTQSHRSGGYFQNFTADHGNQSRTIQVSREGRPVCVYCSKDFGRVQELKRHEEEIHMPWRRCPFCDFMWARPHKIKAHILTKHAETFTAEMLEAIKTLCGRRIVEFLDPYDYGPDLEAMSRCLSSFQS